jgi:hypothetical protein
MPERVGLLIEREGVHEKRIADSCTNATRAAAQATDRMRADPKSNYFCFC